MDFNAPEETITQKPTDKRKEQDNIRDTGKHTENK